MARIDYETEIELTPAAVAEQLRALAADFEGKDGVTIGSEDMSVTVPSPQGDVEYELSVERGPEGATLEDVELELEIGWGSS